MFFPLSLLAFHPLLLSRGKSYYELAVPPPVDLIQQRGIVIFDNLVMEAGMKALAYAANTELATL